MKVLLAYKCHDAGRTEYYSRFTPLGLTSINALLRWKGFNASIVNFSQWSWRRVATLLNTERPDLLGVSVFTFNRHEAMRVAALARDGNPGCLTVAGGPHASHLAHHLLRHYPQIDLVVRGEGEMTALELVRALKRGELRSRLASIKGITFRQGRDIVDTPDRAPIKNLDELPHPAAEGATVGPSPASQMEFVITSRGCPAACSFCSTPDFWGRRIRFRSSANMIDEIRLLRERHGVVYVSVRDDTFTADRKRVIDFCRGLIEAKLDLLWDCQSRVNIVDEERLAWMRRAGCTHVQYGVESGSTRMLRRLNKGITVGEVRRAARLTRRVGLGLSVYLITGIDSEGDQDLAATLRLIDAIKPHDGLVAPLAVYPGTALYERAKRELLLTDDFWVRSRSEAYFVREDAWTRRSMRTLNAALRRAGVLAAYGPRDFARHRKAVGNCYPLRLSVGEFYERRRQLHRAAEEYEALLRDDHQSLWARMRLGGLASRRGAHAAAAEHYRAATRVAASFHLPHRLLGSALLRIKRRDEARSAFARALALYPSDSVARRQLRRLSDGIPLPPISTWSC